MFTGIQRYTTSIRMQKLLSIIIVQGIMISYVMMGYPVQTFAETPPIEKSVKHQIAVIIDDFGSVHRGAQKFFEGEQTFTGIKESMGFLEERNVEIVSISEMSDIQLINLGFSLKK